jgi:hypothetical protein
MLHDASPNTKDGVLHLLTKGQIVEEGDATVESGAAEQGTGEVEGTIRKTHVSTLLISTERT